LGKAPLKGKLGNNNKKKLIPNENNGPEWVRTLEFPIWVIPKFKSLLVMGWHGIEFREATRIDYKPLTQVIAKYIIPQYPHMDKNIIYGRIANFINLKVIGQKARKIRARQRE